jgi:hypothetical protein
MGLSDPRKVRGRKSELLLPDYWSDVFPGVVAVQPSLGGLDLKNTDPFGFEVKARKGLDLLAWMRQARRNTAEGMVPVVIARMNGQGPQSMDEWFTVTRQADFKKLVRSYIGLDR